MARFRPWPVTALIAWTLFTWGNRIPLLWASSTQTHREKVLGTIPIAIFVVLAVVGAVAVLVSADVLVGWARTAALVLAGWSIAYWLVRLPLILAHHHPIPFKAVHTVLAAVAIGLAVWALRRIRTPAPTAAPRPTPVDV